MRLVSVFSLFMALFLNPVAAQRVCAVLEHQGVEEPAGQEHAVISAALPELITIPVVVHIVYNTPEQNISAEQVSSQIEALNRDFRKKNRDTTYIPAAFKQLAADTRIEFKLATTDPAGEPTTGIVRKNTTIPGFGLNDHIKFSALGGDDAWNRDEYLNIWVGNLPAGVMGYASAPGCAPEKDGVVIRYTAFGTTANVRAPYHKGRTAVHEVGHWLGLRHIWGDTSCGDDTIDDTPPQQGPTRGCPGGVVASCSGQAGGSMYMNFMDFTDEECTSMFTLGQADRMRGLFAAGGARSPLLSSNKASGAGLTLEEGLAAGTGWKIFPNPAVNELQVRFSPDEDLHGKQLFLYNHLGQIIRRVAVYQHQQRIDLSALAAGMYMLSTGDGKTQKFIKSPG